MKVARRSLHEENCMSDQQVTANPSNKSSNYGQLQPDDATTCSTNHPLPTPNSKQGNKTSKQQTEPQQGPITRSKRQRDEEIYDPVIKHDDHDKRRPPTNNWPSPALKRVQEGPPSKFHDSKRLHRAANKRHHPPSPPSSPPRSRSAKVDTPAITLQLQQPRTTSAQPEQHTTASAQPVVPTTSSHQAQQQTISPPSPRRTRSGKSLDRKECAALQREVLCFTAAYFQRNSA